MRLEGFYVTETMEHKTELAMGRLRIASIDDQTISHDINKYYDLHHEIILC